MAKYDLKDKVLEERLVLALVRRHLEKLLPCLLRKLIQQLLATLEKPQTRLVHMCRLRAR